MHGTRPRHRPPPHALIRHSEPQPARSVPGARHPGRLVGVHGSRHGLRLWPASHLIPGVGARTEGGSRGALEVRELPPFSAPHLRCAVIPPLRGPGAKLLRCAALCLRECCPRLTASRLQEAKDATGVTLAIAVGKQSTHLAVLYVSHGDSGAAALHTASDPGQGVAGLEVLGVHSPSHFAILELLRSNEIPRLRLQDHVVVAARGAAPVLSLNILCGLHDAVRWLGHIH
mmetsp:Transcript_121150/g.354034  ORF Transcript_121150/g.354034 Transcript_121150/m.354034 type:complete len:230 (-) Transcript_121150:2677-3366(-)